MNHVDVVHFGMDVSQSEVYERLMNAAIRYVSYRMRSEKEIQDFIVKTMTRHHIVAPEVVEHVVQRLTALNYINDDAFAMWWVGQRTGRKSKGAKAIRMELLQKGVDADTIDRAIRMTMIGERSEQELVKAALLKKKDAWNTLAPLMRKKKRVEYLMRRGFSAEAIWGVVDDVPETV